MYLKKLESVGFKSFAERISIEFVPGVTAVVGPNGSGKSNITDAIRWVLGEQSAKSLRGSKMEDIIFQGSDTRKALNVAEVTLVLDNQDKAVSFDYDEISVTRRVYRSGESEFYINKQSCRLKDIIDLFMDSGLGREAFSIISQGKVEEILSSKAEERRTIFEEAAGVLKYKQRKKKSEYKLAETQENLNRVEDIIYEIESQLEPLERQSNTAKRYLELKDTLKEKEISFLVAEIEALHNKWTAIQETIKEEKDKELELKNEIHKKEAWIEEQKDRNQKLDEVIEKLQESLLLSTEQLEKLEGKKQLFSERSKHFDENKQMLTEQKQEAKRKIETFKKQLTEEKDKLQKLQDESTTSKKMIKKLEDKLGRSKEKLSDSIEELKSVYIEYLNEQAAVRNEMQSIERQFSQINGKNEMQAGKFQDTLQLRENLLLEKNMAEKNLSEQQKVYSKKEQLIRQLKTTLEGERKLFEELQAKLYQGYQYIEKMKSKKEMLEEMKEDFQGFFHGVKAILKAREDNKLEQIEGAIIELIDVPKEYITAIETVLGGQAQHIVVQNEAAARAAISWLKKTNQGRATFLPLNTIQERFIPENIRSKAETHHGFVGIAANLIKTDASYLRAVNHLMGHVLIAETLKDATEIAALTGRRYRVVTLDGDVVNPGGAMTGGAVKKTNQSLFTREKDLEEIKGKLVNYEARTSEFAAKVKQQKEKMEATSASLELEESTISQEQRKLQEMQTVNHELEMKLKSLNDSLSIYDQEEKQFKEDTQYLNQRKLELEKDLETIKIKLAETQEEIDKLTLEESQFKENQEQLQEKLHESKLSLAKQQERFRSQADHVSRLEQQLQADSDLLKEYTAKLEDLVQIAAGVETEVEIDQAIEAEKETKANLTSDIQEKRTARSNRTRQIDDEERELREENKRYQALLSSIQQKEVQVNRLDVDLENRLTHLETEYTITFEKAKQVYKKAEDIKLAKNEVQQLKQQISNLGTVNLGAIDEFERISERYNFLTEQQKDLITAKDTLYNVIAELDEEMKQRFETTFDAIKEEFAIVFKELFGGGKAELKLTDPKHILDTGVDIIAQPPGKKLQHLGLLSGGERALTAIALLFAILRVRPVPFCILDEVEAALDEANVSRFAKYVKMYSKNTQFIVITHRKGTMEEADVLYGVTMQESGVSRLVSVKLEETKDLIES
ncbi:chromosome segregation protein SMC [Ralstonia pickettii]|nr:chromosome segregation protein SMC [Ralstonia pickettii]